jgi:endo-1,4-beta-xylanase
MTSSSTTTTTTTLQSLISNFPPTQRSNLPRHIGTAIMPDVLQNDSTYQQIIKDEFNMIVVEHHMKWDPLCSRSKKRGECIYDFTDSDYIVDWAKLNGKRIKGHTLVWHVTSPSWLQDLSGKRVMDEMNRHIHTVMGHYYGQIEVWDVVNEALAPNGTFAHNIFFQACCSNNSNTNGQEYIFEAFRQAKLSDPNPKLFYNDNKVEGLCRKSNSMFDLCKNLIDQKCPLDGIGVQAHFDAAGTGEKRPATPQSIMMNIDRFASLNLTMNISEMDVRIAKLVPNTSNTTIINNEQAQIQIYEETLTHCFTHPYFEGVIFWGFTDKHSWVHQFYWNDTPLLWDIHYNKKPAYFGVESALKHALEIVHKVGKQPHNIPSVWVGDWVPQSPSIVHDNNVVVNTDNLSGNDDKRQKIISATTTATTTMTTGTDLADWQL